MTIEDTITGWRVRRKMTNSKHAEICTDRTNGFWRVSGFKTINCPSPKILESVFAMTEKTTINFYSVTAEFGEFSNFAAFPIRLQGKTWPTSEHYFQAQKFDDEEHVEEIRKAKSPMIAARMGRSRKRPLRREWESVKDSVMREALLAKFTQHDDLRTLLLSTGDAVLVEQTANDSYWGDGGDGSGKNRLGRILMEVREQLRSGDVL